MTDRSHCRDVGVEQARLAEPPGSSQADCNPIGGGALQAVELGAAINQTDGLNRPLIAERIHRTAVYDISVQH